MDKKCSKCRRVKLMSNFINDRNSNDKHGRYCKECRKIYYRSYRKTPKSLELQRRLQKEWDKKHPNRVKVYSMVQKHREELIKATCESCSSNYKLELHHPDYSQPLYVITLCMICHKDLHNRRFLSESYR